jgi:hypothetical protein
MLQSEPHDLLSSISIISVHDFSVEQLPTPPSEQSAVGTPAPVENIDDDDDDVSHIPGLGVFAKHRKIPFEAASYRSTSPLNETTNSPIVIEVYKEMKNVETTQDEMDEMDVDIEVLSNIDAAGNILRSSYLVEEAISETEEQSIGVCTSNDV